MWNSNPPAGTVNGVIEVGATGLQELLNNIKIHPASVN